MNAIDAHGMTKTLLLGAFATALSSAGCPAGSRGNPGDGGVVLTSAADADQPTPSLLSPGLSALPLDLDGGGPFVGMVTLRIESAALKGPQSVDVEIDMPKQLVAFDIARSSELPSGLRGFLDTTSHKLTMVLDIKRAAAVTDLSKIQISSTERKERAEQAKNDWIVSATEHPETVAGNECRMYLVTKKATGERIEACFATNLPRVDLTDILPARWIPLQWADYLENARVPLRVAEFEPGGKRMFLIEVTRVRAQPIDDARRKVPVGYKTVTLPPPVTKGLPSLLGLRPL